MLLIASLRLIHTALGLIGTTLWLIALWSSLRNALRGTLRSSLGNLLLGPGIRIAPCGEHHLANSISGLNSHFRLLGLTLRLNLWLTLRLILKLRLWLTLRLILELRLRLALRLRLRLSLGRLVGCSGHHHLLSAYSAKPGVVVELGSAMCTIFHSL